MADDNKPLKYMRYAIGEIVLVVVGILIALQINTWNEQRKGKEKVNHLFEQVQKELLYNINKSNVVIDFYRDVDSLLYRVINKKVTYDDYKTKHKYRTLISSYQAADLVDEAFNNLIENDSPLSQLHDSIVLKLKGLYGTSKKGVDNWDIKVLSQEDIFFEKLKNEKEWFSLIGKATDEQIDYLLNDPFYLNEVKLFELNALQEHLMAVLDFKRDAINIYAEISDYLDLKKDTSVVKNIFDYEHYIGTYEYDSLYNAHIIQKSNTLKLNWIAKNDTIILGSIPIYPDSKTYCTFEWHFGQLIFDENDKVTSIVMSNGSNRDEYKKID